MKIFFYVVSRLTLYFLLFGFASLSSRLSPGKAKVILAVVCRKAEDALSAELPCDPFYDYVRTVFIGCFDLLPSNTIPSTIPEPEIPPHFEGNDFLRTCRCWTHFFLPRRLDQDNLYNYKKRIAHLP